MKSRVAAALVALLACGSLFAQYRSALPGYQFEFPRDFFNHPDFQTEWWYYTGNLKSASGHRFGFELTFFRQAVSRDASPPSAWDLKDVYIAHLALSDLDGRHFFHSERINRAGPGIAGVSEVQQRIWNGNWSVQWKSSRQELEAVDPRFRLQLSLDPRKPPVIHGESGVSQKSEGIGRASYYISLTRLAASGELDLHGEKLAVSGLAWMDHEFFTHQLAANQTGWDWLSLQLDDNSELMLYRIRRKDGSVDPYSAGTYVDSQGKPTHLRVGDYVLLPLSETWTSRETGARYPIAWKIAVPRLGLELEAHTPLADQELSSSADVLPTYWEGAITLSGHRGHKPLGGVGYLEMTGYDKPVHFAP